MTGRTPVAEQPLVPGDMTPWATASARLETPEKDRTYWLATVRPDGRPHVRPILGLWLDDAFYFITGETTRKAKNLHANPQCVLTATSLALPALDVIIEGDAVKVTDHHKVQQVVDAYASRLHWPLTVGDGGVFGPNAPTSLCGVRAHTHDGRWPPRHCWNRRRRRRRRLLQPDPLAFQAATDASAAPTS
jgi:Pyridoxamine 5'-phosphate oxidase